MKTKSTYKNIVPAAEQALKILLLLAKDRSGKKSMAGICKELGIHKSKGYALVNTLQAYSFVQRDPETKTYAIGLGVLPLSNRVLDSLDIRKTISPFLRKLALETKSTAVLAMVADRHVFIVAKDEGEQDLGLTVKVGHRLPITWGVFGKSIVSFLPDSERASILSGKKLYFHINPSKLDLDRLKQEMIDCRKKGFAVELGDIGPGINSVGSPVFGPGGKLLGAIVVLGTFPLDAVEKYGLKVAKAAKEFSKSVGGGITMDV